MRLMRLATVGWLLGCLAVPGLAPGQERGSAREESASSPVDGVQERGVKDRIKQRLEKRKLSKQQSKLEGQVERAELELQMRQARLAKVREQATIRVVGPNQVQVGDKVFRGRRAVRRAQRAARRPRKQLGKLEREVEDYTAELDGPLDYSAGEGIRRRGGLRSELGQVQERLQELSGGPPRVRPPAPGTGTAGAGNAPPPPPLPTPPTGPRP